MRIGLITFSDYNYGSALQCYATQQYLNEHYGECILVQRKRSRSHFFSRAKTVSFLLYSCLCHPFQSQKIIKIFMAQRIKSLNLSQESLDAIHRFKLYSIVMECFSLPALRKEAKTDAFDYFFCGSDQVWNGARVTDYDFFFMRFAPQKKRVAWAPSFGGDSISSYNLRRYKKYISQFNKLSVREESGNRIIRYLTGKEAIVLCDPVILLTGNQWRKRYKTCSSFSMEEKYLCLFFIDSISESAICFVDQLSRKKGYTVVSFGYKYDSFSKLRKHIHVDGSPMDFLKCIDGAETVVTDSFHATVFATLLKTDFYVFTRKYTHSQNQSTRLTHFLHSVGADNRFDSLEEQSPIDFSISEDFFSSRRELVRSYLQCISSGESNNE